MAMITLERVDVNAKAKRKYLENMAQYISDMAYKSNCSIEADNIRKNRSLDGTDDVILRKSTKQINDINRW